MIKWCGLSPPPRKKEKGEGAACKVARQFVSGIITFRCVRGAHAQLIKSAPYGRPTAKRIRIFQFVEETSRELLHWPKAGTQCSCGDTSPPSSVRGWNANAISLAAERCKLWSVQRRSKCSEIESITVTRYCQKFIVNFDLGFLCRAFFSFAKKSFITYIYSCARLVVITLNRNYD